MLEVSNAYRELVKSNIRPKAEPIIKVSGIDGAGKEIEIVWKAKDIKDLNYKRSIDPIGRELPLMELIWTEIYTDKMNAQNYPEKYTNIIEHLAVELSFVQNINFYQTWNSLFKSGKTWKELFSLATTWKKLKTEVTQEVFTMPKMFLTAKPTINGQTITWVARELFYFVGEKQTRKFGRLSTINPVTLEKILSVFLLDARAPYLKSLDIFDGLTDTVTKLLQSNEMEEMNKNIICDGNTSDIILNLASIYCRYWDYKGNIAVLKRFAPVDSGFEYNSKVMHIYPVLQKNQNVSGYSFKHYIVKQDFSKTYEKEPDSIKYFNNGYVWFQYYLNGFGEAFYEPDGKILNPQSLTRANLVGRYSDVKKATVTPISYVGNENYIAVKSNGEVFEEDNPINPYNAEEQQMIARKDLLVDYFGGNKYTLSFEALPNFAVETGDVISVETNLYENDANLFKKAVIISNEISYNGAVKQKIIAHEVSL